MRRQFISLSVSICFALGLSGCIKAVMGPDLARRPTPFIDTGAIHITEKRGLTDTVISASPAGDKAVVKLFYLGDRVYNAAVTYTPFTPIIAETIRDRKDYWLVGFNMSQTPDRAFYAILRYPHDKPLLARTTRDDFEMQVLTCPGPGMQPKPAATEADSSAAPAEMAPSLKRGRHSKPRATEAEPPPPVDASAEDDSQAMAGDEAFCFRATVPEIEALADTTLKAQSGSSEDTMNRKASAEDAKDSPWVKLTVTAE